MRLALLAVLLASPLIAQSSVETPPSNTEALAIYEINRARANPQAYDSANSLGGILAGITPASPLALNERLVTSSRFHSTEMAQNGYFAHTSAITGNQPNLMVRNAGYPLISSFPNAANNLESLACQFTPSSGGISYSAPNAIRALIVDSGVSPPGHRYHLLAWGGSSSEINFYRQFREIGTGYAEGFRPEMPFSSSTPPDGSGAYWSIHTGVRDTTVYFICGFVYNDSNSNGRYDLGEGLGGVTVSANGGGSVVVNATTNSAGMYWLNLNPATWTLTCSGGSFGGPTYAQVTLSTNNVAVDFRQGNVNVDVNFGAWGALAGSAVQNGSTNPGPGSGGTSGTGSGGGSGGGGGGGTPASSSDSGGGGCTTQEAPFATGMLAWLALAGLALARLRRCRRLGS
ncbi:hypothetical protein EDM80_01575 [bacterium]|nr:MAG: hypothetical protein EDM80_01575 [bacterium]RIK62078.1 MAG: hypothetical protein DCC64_11220 [Planctomycetota bacterium]